jgi:hypothetical protein
MTDWFKWLLNKSIELSHENAYPLFLAASRLNQQEIEYNGEAHTLSFSHKPTRVNYWHFELWVKDNSGNCIPRDKSNIRIKYLAKSILEYILAESVIFKSAVKPFKSLDFE